MFPHSSLVAICSVQGLRWWHMGSDASFKSTDGNGHWLPQLFFSPCTSEHSSTQRLRWHVRPQPGAFHQRQRDRNSKIFSLVSCITPHLVWLYWYLLSFIYYCVTTWLGELLHVCMCVSVCVCAKAHLFNGTHPLSTTDKRDHCPNPPQCSFMHGWN